MALYLYFYQSGDTALILASENGHTEALKLLVEAGADFGIQNEVVRMVHELQE